jgi:hypothetical protein
MAIKNIEKGMITRLEKTPSKNGTKKRQILQIIKMTL